MLHVKFKLLVFVIVLTSTALLKAEYKYVDKVDPWIESNRGRFFFFHAANVPFGFASPRPDNMLDAFWGSSYKKNNNYISGISHVHDWQLSGIQVMPTVGWVPKEKGCKGWESETDHNDEIAQAGYHKFFLKRYGIEVELTATERVALHQYTYTRPGRSEIIINLGGISQTNNLFGEAFMQSSYFKRNSNDEIVGWIDMHGHLSYSKHRLFFSIKFDKPFDELNHFKGNEFLHNVTEGNSETYGGATVVFNQMNAGEQLKMKVGISLTGLNGARLNRITEIPDDTWNFEKVRKDAKDKWEKMLARIEVKGGTEKQRVKFYTDLFHVLCGRCIVNDVDGAYLDLTWGLNNGKGVVKHLPIKDGKLEFNMYNYDALWITRWNLNAILGLAYPDIYSEFVKSQLQMYKDGGLLPRGPVAGDYSFVMTSAPVISFIAGAYNKGIKDFDADLAWEAMSDAATIGGLYEKSGYEYCTWDGTNGAREYMTMGYVPYDMQGGVAHKDGAGVTLEYSFQDYALANFSKKLNKKGINIAPLANVTVSSEKDKDQHSAKRAIDGRPLRSGIADVGVEWLSDGEYTPWIQLDFDEPHNISVIKIKDRISPYSNILKGRLCFSNGDVLDVDELPCTGEPLCVQVNKKEIEWIRFEVQLSEGTDVGLNDMEVWDDRSAYEYYMKRSQNWKNLFDPQVKFIRPKSKSGEWLFPFDLLDSNANSNPQNEGNDFVEANSWQSTFSISHDLLGLAELMGGVDVMADTLDFAFRMSEEANFIGSYGHGYVSYGNQPGLSAAHVFNYIGKPWLSQYWARKVYDKVYSCTDADNGYGHHDEDQGQMGSISLLLAMGLFNVTGGCSEHAIYELTAPVFDEIIIKLDNDYYKGKEFKILVHNNAPQNIYIQKVELNHQRMENCWFFHEDYVQGGLLELWLGEKPNQDWGINVLPPH